MGNRTCLLCGKRSDGKLLCLTITRSQPAVVLLSSLVLFNAIDLEEAKRICETNAKRRLCNQHYVDAAKFMMSELACLGIRVDSYMDHSRGELVSFLNEKDIPLHLFDSLRTTARKIDENLDISVRKVRDFLNSCLYRFDVLNSTTNATNSQQEAASVFNTEIGTVVVKPVALLCGTSGTPEYTAVEQGHPVKDECDDYDVEELDQTDPDLLEKIIPVKGDRLLSLFRFCPKCGTQISRKRRRIVIPEKGPSPTVQYFCNRCGGRRCWYAS